MGRSVRMLAKPIEISTGFDSSRIMMPSWLCYSNFRPNLVRGVVGAKESVEKTKKMQR